MPRQFGSLLTGHDATTAQHSGWASLRNGKLLSEAASRFDALLTVDQSLRHQQDTGALPLPVIVLAAVSNRLKDLTPLAPATVRLLGTRLERRVYVIGP